MHRLSTGYSQDYPHTSEQGAAMGYTVFNIDPEQRSKYQERPGLEGPFWSRAGQVYYYDPKAGQYYNPQSDFYIPAAESHDLFNFA
jgi:hypothetical protein